MFKSEYIKEINKMLKCTNDIVLIDLIYKLLKRTLNGTEEKRHEEK